MVTLRRPNRPTRGTGFSMRYLSLLIAATLMLVIWAYQRVFFDESWGWLLYFAIILAAWAFGLAFYNILKAWRKHSKRS